MISVTNVGRGKRGSAKYEVHVNTDLICKFEHHRSDGLAVCIARAAIAVAKKREQDVDRD